MSLQDKNKEILQKIENITNFLEPKFVVGSQEYNELMVYVALNFSRGYFHLRSILPKFIPSSLIERKRQFFIRNLIYTGYMNEIYYNCSDEFEFRIAFWLEVLVWKNEIVKSDSTGKMISRQYYE